MKTNNAYTVENEYRPLNYWGWLENITPEEVRWQIREMHRAGLGGYVMHARGGLEIPYMGKQWQNSVAAMIDEGRELGMLTVVDDEDGWPSGFGAGEVNGKGEDYWLKWLQFERVKAGELKTSNATIGVYIPESDESYRRVDAAQIKNSGQEVLHIYYKCNRYYVDNLDPAVVQEFIKASYEKYYSEFRTEFGSGIQAIFSDEPQLARQFIPWSRVLPAEFAKSFGYDLRDVLPALFFPAGNYEKARYDFWSTVNRLFTDSYSRQIGEWCGKHRVMLSGHTVLEEHLGLQMLGSAGAMTFYEHMQIPGVDWLCRIGVNNMLIKQVTSVSQQLGKKRTLSEMYGCAGWNVSFEELKWIGEWHYVLGINLMLQHLGLYSLKGSRKREYPASLFYQQPWWDEYRHFNDYFAGLSKIMVESEPQIDLLVLHPLKSAWIAFEGQDHDKIGWDHHWAIEGHIANPDTEYFKEIKELDKSFKYLTDSLLELNYDFHYGDETLISRFGYVEGNRIRVGRSLYSAVIIPPSISMDRSTLKLLTEFAANGGKILSVGRFPELIEGELGEESNVLMSRVLSISNDKGALKEMLARILVRPVSVILRDGAENKHVYCCTTKKDGEWYYYIVNTSLQNTYEVEIKIEKKGSVFKLNPADGALQHVEVLDFMHLEPGESILLVQGNREAETVVPAVYTGKVSTTLSLPTDIEWNIQEHDLNSLTLDRCEYSIDDGNWEPELSVIKLQQKMLDLGRPANVKMRFRFYAEDEIKAPVYLVLEEPDRFIVMLNGEAVSAVDCGWWVDKSFRKLEITGRISKGWNEILLFRYFYCSEKVYAVLKGEGVHEAESNRLRYDTELESIYLLGDFMVSIDGNVRNIDKRALMVNGTFRLAPMTGRIRPDNLVTGGFPFFAGKITLSRKVNMKRPEKGQRMVLKLCRPDATVTRIFVNGKLLKTLTWAPYSVDITDAVIDGENEISIELTNSLRNLLGPHHHADGELYAVGPFSYKDEGKWTDEYCFVRFGIEDIYRKWYESSATERPVKLADNKIVPEWTEGEMFTLVLKDKGIIRWDSDTDWSLPAPD